ncbi:MAG: 50S ribosomal protein L25/general stress protein Ctc [Coleofasciculus sp. S288]|nr:50S ribosomal protein L25/general stress protein Ctc [Coleofasciculus sp. S288]
MDVTVECQKRPEGKNPRALRRDGLIPAVLYGHKGADSDALVLNAKATETLLKKATINNTLVQLNIPELPWSGKALLREVQTHPWKPQVYHLSFFSVGAQETLNVGVPLHFVGDAVGVREGGVLDPVITELEVQCAPDRIPEFIEVDVSNLAAGESLHIRELVLPEGVTAMQEQDGTIVTITAPLSATEPQEEETAVSSPEG